MASLPYHELDYPKANYVQRLKYHEHCSSSWCDFSSWVEKGNKPEDYARTTAKDSKGKLITWGGGLYKGMDLLYPEAFESLVDLYKYLGNVELMGRCSEMATQNINESIHSKLRIVVKNIKNHSMERVVFACQSVSLVHNFGHFDASLYHFIGSMTSRMAKALQRDDKISMYNAARKHEVKEGGGRTHRLKRRTNQPSPGPGNRDPAYAPGEEDMNPIFMDPNVGNDVASSDNDSDIDE